MNTHAKPNIRKLNDLVNKKEQEWRDLLQEQIESLIKELAEKDELVKLEQIRFRKLKDDFEYNLSLLSDRDNELERYDELFQQLKANDNLRNAELSEMNIKVDDAQSKYNLLQKEATETQKHYQLRLQEYQDEMSTFYSKKTGEIEKERSEYEDLKRKLQQNIRDVEEDACFTKQMIVNEFNDKSVQKDGAFRLQLDKKDSEIHALLLKIKILSKELDMVRNSTSQTVEDLEVNRESAIKLERKLKEKDWELQDNQNMNSLKFQELEMHSEEIMKKARFREEELIGRCKELEKVSNERERMFENLKLSCNEIEEKLRYEIKQLYKKGEEQELCIKKLHWNEVDRVKEKETEINSYKEQLNELKIKLNEELELRSKSTVAKDLELESVRSSEDRLRRDLHKVKDDLERYKRDLSLSMEREKILENAKSQLELDWRGRYETKESDLYHKHEDLIRNLNQTKEEAIAHSKSLKHELVQRDHLIKLLQTDKHIAMKCLQKHGIRTENIFTDSIPEKETDAVPDSNNELRLRNNQLKEVIKEMRTEMEMLTQQMHSSRTSTPDPTTKVSGYVTELEVELQNLKTKNRSLLDKIEDLTKENKPPYGRTSPRITDNAVKNHLKELNDTIGLLRNDKVQITAMLKSKEASITHLKNSSVKVEQEKQQLEIMIEKLQYDITSKEKIQQQSLKSMKTRISELELQLQQSRSDAEIYYKSVVERNMDATQVYNKLSQLKIERTAPEEPPVKLIRPGVNETKTISNLKQKLKLAVERIKELTTERSRLINVGNKLRAEISHLKGKDESSAASDVLDDTNKAQTTSDVRRYKNNVQSKLEALQRAQYECTGKKLKENNSNISDVNVGFMATDSHNTGDMEQSHQSIAMTSSDHSSIKEIWKLLDNEELLSTPGDTNIESELNGEDFGISVVGKPIVIDERNKKPVYHNTVKLRQPKGKQKTRNYNIKNDH